MTREPAGGRVLVVVPTTVDGPETAGSRGGADIADDAGAREFPDGDDGTDGDAVDRDEPFLRGGSSSSRTEEVTEDDGGGTAANPEAEHGDEADPTGADSASRSDEADPAEPDPSIDTDPTAADVDPAGRDCDPETVLALLDEELDAEVVVRCGETATEYVSELGPTLDCVVVLGDNRPLIHDLIEDGAVPTIVCEPPVIGRIDKAVAGENSIEELVERIRVELEHDHTRNDLRESNARLTALSHYAEDITACETVDAVAERTVEAMTDALAYHYCVVRLVEGELLVPRASTLPKPKARVFNRTDGVAGRTLRRSESEIVADIQADPDAIPEHEDLRAGLSVPIGDRGVIQVASTDRDAFDEQDREFVEILAGYTREALERIEREVTLRKERDRLHAFFGELPVPAVHIERLDGVASVKETNRAYADQFGEVEPGDHLSEIVSTDVEREQFEAALETGRVSADIVERPSDDGEVREFALSVVPVPTPGIESCAYGIYVDRATELLGALE
ncbi:GAF domain-containing protein [Halobellus litoreus]|uniref:GAF domain-containing protein n=1 Tax=Halobellus litoreus TaxID=755310 RepID=A0ABD6DQN0_9EURY|nr:GAF domain-containing protein [Halobellus litoreus]